MSSRMPRHAHGNALPMTRRSVTGALAALPLMATSLPTLSNAATSQTTKKETPSMERKAFVYTEIQASIPFSEVPWQEMNVAIAEQSGFIDKTWLSGRRTDSVGGLYSFASMDDALKFCTEFFPAVARDVGVAHNTRAFDASLSGEASADMNSPHFGGNVDKEPGAFVYTEVQVSVPFDKAPWRDRNPVLREQKGLISKTWLSGYNTNTLGGLDAFDTVENAYEFAVNEFPKTAAALNAAFYTRIFDATVTEEASRGLHSPYYL